MTNLFDLKDKVALITGGAGVLGSGMGNVLAQNGVTVGIVGLSIEDAQATVKMITDNGGKAFAVTGNVLVKEDMELIKDKILADYGKLDILINAAGGNMPGATIGPNQTIFDVNIDHFKKVVDLNLFGSILPSIVLTLEISDIQF